MNERINELYKQSLTHKTGVDYNNNPLYEIRQNPGLFAQLIIEKFAYDLMDLRGSSPEHIIYAAKQYGVEL